MLGICPSTLPQGAFPDKASALALAMSPNPASLFFSPDHVAGPPCLSKWLAHRTRSLAKAQHILWPQDPGSQSPS